MPRLRLLMEPVCVCLYLGPPPLLHQHHASGPTQALCSPCPGPATQQSSRRCAAFCVQAPSSRCPVSRRQGEWRSHPQSSVRTWRPLARGQGVKSLPSPNTHCPGAAGLQCQPLGSLSLGLRIDLLGMLPPDQTGPFCSLSRTSLDSPGTAQSTGLPALRAGHRHPETRLRAAVVIRTRGLIHEGHAADLCGFLQDKTPSRCSSGCRSPPPPTSCRCSAPVVITQLGC